MIRMVCSNLAKAAAAVFAVAVFNFILIHATPGDPALIIAGESGGADEAYLAAIREQYGLDKPFIVQLLAYLGKLAQFDLGFSYRAQRTVASLISERLGATILLAAVALLLAIAGGIALGTMAALKAGTWIDRAISGFSAVCYGTPAFWTGMMMVLVFSVFLGWLPPFGMQTIGRAPGLIGAITDIATHLIMPASAMALFYMATFTRFMRASVLETRFQDFVKTARAKGLTRRRVVFAHIIPNSLLPIVTIAGVQIAQMIGGSVLIETVFAWPGVGRLAFDAVMQRDYNLILGIFFVSSLLVVGVNLIVDVAYAVIDPRVGGWRG